MRGGKTPAVALEPLVLPVLAVQQQRRRSLVLRAQGLVEEPGAHTVAHTILVFGLVASSF